MDDGEPPRYDRTKLRYPSDVTEHEWALIESLIPPAKRGGRGRDVNVRDVFNGVLYVLRTGCHIETMAAPSRDLHNTRGGRYRRRNAGNVSWRRNKSRLSSSAAVRPG